MENRYRKVVVEARRRSPGITIGTIPSDIFITHASYKEPGGWSISDGMAALSVPPH